MKWTKRHSQNAVAAKARKRMAAGEALFAETAQRVPGQRRTRARFTIQIRDNKNGDSLTLNLHESPWDNVWVSAHGVFSSAKLGRAVALILQGGR